MKYTIVALRALKDNYVWLIHDDKSAIVVDPTEAHVVEQYLQQHNLSLKIILLTHNHPDHTGGVKILCQRYHPECIDNFNQQLADGQMLHLADMDLSVKVLLTPGHTFEHVCYLVDDKHLFCGDTLFGMGCGRVFTNDFVAMYNSLNKIKALPESTLCYPAHEYTANNLRFITSIDDNHAYYQDYAKYLVMKLTSLQNSLPTVLADELRYNLFLRCDEPHVWGIVSAKSGELISDEENCFVVLRQLRNAF